MKTKIKVGKREFIIDETDIIFDNGSLYQILRLGANYRYYLSDNTVSKKLFNDLYKSGCIFTNDDLRLEAIKNHNEICRYYKFNIKNMVRKFGYLEVK